MRHVFNLTTQKELKLILKNPIKSDFKVYWQQLDIYQTYRKIIDNVNPLIIGSIQIEVYCCFHKTKNTYERLELPNDIDLTGYEITKHFTHVTDVYQARGKQLIVVGNRPRGTCWLFDEKSLINGYTFFPN